MLIELFLTAFDSVKDTGYKIINGRLNLRNFLFAYFSFNKTATKNKEETIINIQIVDKFLIKINIEEIHYVVQEDKKKI